MTNIHQSPYFHTIDYFDSVFTTPLGMYSFDSISFDFSNVINKNNFITLDYHYPSDNKWLLFFEDFSLLNTGSKKIIFNSPHTEHLNFLSTIFLTLDKLSALWKSLNS